MDKLILLKRNRPLEYEIHIGEINQAKNLLLTVKDGDFAERLVNGFNNIGSTVKRSRGKKNVYGFETGKHVIDISAENEQEAMITLVKKFWPFVNDNGKIELLGKRKK